MSTIAIFVEGQTELIFVERLLDNVQDIVYSENGHDIVNSKRRGYVSCDAVTRVISLAVDTCILQPGSYPGKASAFVL
jgi:hypothetical protein